MDTKKKNMQKKMMLENVVKRIWKWSKKKKN